MALTFTALEEDFTGKWPAVLHIENPEYAATLYYAGADAAPHSDVGEYAADLAAWRLTRKSLTLVCEPKIPERETNLDILQGQVFLKPMPVMPHLTVDEARHLAEDMLAATGSAEALEEFIAARFGPCPPYQGR